ncbi:MAG: hypothetical protein APF76_10345 [Desulfitibacter sp. BRH_c19]|nr:MAG: hypothetical protein APF76_10345 [Desulfitibacter sp. BRH_c19]
MKNKKFKKHDKGNHPQSDQFREGKIGSGFMSTIEGQPHLEDFVENTKNEENPMEAKKTSIKDY